MSDTAIHINEVTKMYGPTMALDNLTLSIQDNEFFTLLGPSGCGKTTLLRCIAGFEQITRGDIQLFGQSLSGLAPNERPVNTVFQQYALFPHMTVLENVMFGLKRQGKTDAEAKTRADHVLQLVQLDSLAARLPSQLSGGQQQRVALARALAPNPKVLLLDEPLSALDLKLRQEVRFELQQIQHETGITFVFVTHDQEEAITMSDRIAVMSEGTIQQIGSPNDIYESPENRFVADFIGETNLIDVTVTEINNGIAVCELPGGISLQCKAAENARLGPGHISIRPERLTIANSAASVLQGVVARQTYLGTDQLISIDTVSGFSLSVRLQNTNKTDAPVIGSTVGIEFNDSSARLLSD